MFQRQIIDQINELRKTYGDAAVKEAFQQAMTHSPDFYASLDATQKSAPKEEPKPMEDVQST